MAQESASAWEQVREQGWEQKQQDNGLSLSVLSISGDMNIQVNQKNA